MTLNWKQISSNYKSCVADAPDGSEWIVKHPRHNYVEIDYRAARPADWDWKTVHAKLDEVEDGSAEWWRLMSMNHTGTVGGVHTMPLAKDFVERVLQGPSDNRSVDSILQEGGFSVYTALSKPPERAYQLDLVKGRIWMMVSDQHIRVRYHPNNSRFDHLILRLDEVSTSYKGEPIPRFLPDTRPIAAAAEFLVERVVPFVQRNRFDWKKDEHR